MLLLEQFYHGFLPVSNGSLTDAIVPTGWQRCDGSIIPAPSIWAGQKTPDLNNEKRFLRGAPDDTVLIFEEDMLQDHEHVVTDHGHTHVYTDEHVIRHITNIPKMMVGMNLLYHSPIKQAENGLQSRSSENGMMDDWHE